MSPGGGHLVKRILPCAFLTVLLLSLAACATNPVTGRKEMSLVSPEQELQLGKDGYTAAVAEYGRYDDPALAAYVDSVGQRVARASHLPDLAWHFTVLDDPTVNAFAMPGGYIYITRGILTSLNSEAQLAGVLGHEIGHVTHRHTAESMTQQQLVGLGFGIAQIASSTLRRYSGSAQQALGLMFLSYSRAHETEADELGVAYSTAAGYDSREIPSTYAMLKRVSQAAGSSIPAFLSTHPDPGEREARTTQLSNAAVAGKTGLMIRQRAYIEHLEGVVYGRDPRQGYFEGRTYFHPELGIEMDLPEGWKTQDSRASMQAQEPHSSAAIQVSLADAGQAAPADYVKSLVASGKVTDARGDAELIGGYVAWMGTLIVPGDNNTTSIFDAAYVRISGTSMLELLGQSHIAGDEYDRQIRASMRSVRPLADSLRRSPTPARVHLADAPAAGTFSDEVAKLGPLGVDANELSIINNVQPDETVLAGTRLKLVRPAHLH
jgi:predicted Zn-dependent protease